jgi:Ran GTPase-activating protein (RanGAP) involved in mRNA processing and transport
LLSAPLASSLISGLALCSYLDLSNNQLTACILPSVFTLVEHLEHLDLSRVQLQDKLSETILSSFADRICCSSLQHLSLHSNRLGSAAIALLALLLRSGHPLRTLDLSRNLICATHLQLLPRASVRSPRRNRLRTLDLSFNALPPSPSIELANAAISVLLVPSLSSIACDAIQATSWADRKQLS